MGKKVKYGEFKPENSDGCTLVSPYFKYLTKEDSIPFKQCCIEHDKAYYYGGDVKLRKEADKKLRKCIIEHGYPVLAWIMYIAVRVFSGPKMPFSWSWEENVIVLPEKKIEPTVND